MKGFIFDYQGTLSTLKDPIGFLESLRRKYPEAKIILHTGSILSSLPSGMIQACDCCVEKPSSIRSVLLERGIVLDEVIFVDDDPYMNKAAMRIFKGKCILIAPSELLTHPLL